jgi:hypothetical protein
MAFQKLHRHRLGGKAHFYVSVLSEQLNKEKRNIVGGFPFSNSQQPGLPSKWGAYEFLSF